MARAKQMFIAAATVGALVIAAAFLAAPHACEGGLDLYFWCGVVALVVLLSLPFAFRSINSVLGRVAAGIGFAVLGGVIWIAGLFVANIQIMCRLF
jgi:hypothetical protein